MAHKSIGIPDLTGQTWLITGATSGVGLETARSASDRGARVVLAVRDTGRGRQVADSLPGPSRVVELDLASLESVRRAAADVRDGEPEPIDVLVNNAGAITPRRRETADGVEMLLGVNVLGPFHFSNLVLPAVQRRVVIVGSNAHKAATFDFDDPHFRRRRWTPAAAYAQSKLGDMLWGLALDQRLRDGRAEAGARSVDVQLTHPGWAATGITNASGNAAVDTMITGVCSVFAQPATQAALTTMFAATRPLPPCSYTGPDGIRNLRGMPTLIGRSAEASDPAIAERLWQLAETAIAA
ncbi:SDR family NAD(P)-dependent oxidoreductase [Dietzia cercidiphylli]|uniref:SDR family NAD(P)-dependent oxidoreductase n=1 Tax=Dietzia cercidiphylli TaxID=498199 RepID=UPI00223B52D3|nr:SDR family NAD(P)-dependent oxidoreductase [Dietzia cercidiphylli]MCT1514114.1 SDR family NAD(P)-dependent oxidoreductase [Dietzia cercidiphylli]